MQVVLLDRLLRNEAHLWSTHCFTDRRPITEIVLLPVQIRLHKPRSDQSNLMSIRSNHASPVVRTLCRFQCHYTRRQTPKEIRKSEFVLGACAAPCALLHPNHAPGKHASPYPVRSSLMPPYPVKQTTFHRTGSLPSGFSAGGTRDSEPLRPSGHHRAAPRRRKEPAPERSTGAAGRAGRPRSRSRTASANRCRFRWTWPPATGRGTRPARSS